MCEVLQIAYQDMPKTKEKPLLATYIMINLMLVAFAISIVVMASEPCHLPEFGIHSVKRWLRQMDLNLLAKFRFVCLLAFPLATIANLVILLENKE
ncbi:unnamed protein product [Cylicocyclus nassatus]|uniref:Transmembrane protein n=1 Tax=Cylicocyclus nassatus TaxID=53992 RepID=A0AA36GMZ6_CYLNA|nr:unnamed protein product [Cylicocyclus nassatus]